MPPSGPFVHQHMTWNFICDKVQGKKGLFFWASLGSSKHRLTQSVCFTVFLLTLKAWVIFKPVVWGKFIWKCLALCWWKSLLTRCRCSAVMHIMRVSFEPVTHEEICNHLSSTMQLCVCVCLTVSGCVWVCVKHTLGFMHNWLLFSY